MIYKHTLAYALAWVGLLAAQSATAQTAMQYPPTRKSDQTDTYFGTRIADPYRWLEDDRSPETAEWVKTQNGITYGYLDNIPYRQKMLTRLEQLTNYERFSPPTRAGKYYFFYRNDGLQNQAVVYRQEGLAGKPEVFLDPNKLSAEGTTTVTLLDFSKDDKYAAFSVQQAGSDWADVIVYETATARQLPDTLHWAKFSGAAWFGDGFFYSRYPAPTGSALSQRSENQKVYYHKLGQPQAEDELIYEDTKHPLRYLGAGVTEDGQYLVVQASDGTSGNEILVSRLDGDRKKFITLCPGYSYDYDVVGTAGRNLLVRTNNKAQNFRLVSIDPANKAAANWKDILPERADLFEGAAVVGGQLYAQYLKDVTTRLYLLDKTGKLKKEIALPGLGTVASLSGHEDDKEVFFIFTSFTSPSTVYRADLAGNVQVFRKPKYDFPLADYEVNQVFYPSKDGTKVPMFIVHKKGLERDGARPTLLYGYGGFNISVQPGFSPAWLTLVEQGGVVAYANIRGGGEYGEKWHKGGMLLKKQNVFDDFIAAAEYLQKEKYCDAAHLAIEGRSNGGLLVGACMTQRPELFGVAFPGVGVMDMLRYQKFTVGWGWAVEYGASDSARHFKNLVKYSPLHNLKPGTRYPATMIVTADHDDRVVPAHSFKYAARLQECQAPAGPPTLVRIETNAGHGAGKPIKKQLEERADLLSFMLWNMNVKELK